jgi:signal transduction histidine kinase
MHQQAVPLRKKQITLTLALAEDLKPCCGDQEQLERALWNLVDNAIKFTPPGGAITLTSRMTEDRISVTVQDSGVGIPKEELPSLFVEFQRLKGAANTEGSGLGLFIVKNIIEAHDGELTVESEDGAGTCFNISLPTRTEEHCDLLQSR